MGRILNSLRISFLERNQIVIGIIGIMAVLIGSVLALLLSGGVFASTYSVTAVFPDAAGIRAGDKVTVAGLEAGSIGFIEIEDGTVSVELKVNNDVEMPSDAEAEIVVETLLGRKVVQLAGGSSSTPLADGDVIPMERTITPIEIVDLNDISVRLMEESDAAALEQLMSELTEITEGKSDELEEVIDGLIVVTETIESKKNELTRLLESLETLATTFGDRDQTLVSLIDSYNVVLGNLADRREELSDLLVQTDLASHEIADLVGRNRPALDRTLTSLHSALRVVNDHQLDLAATISYMEQAVEGYASVGYSQGVPNRWANIFVQSLGPVGVDAIAGPCGLIDQVLDEFIGEDPRSCEERQEMNEHDGGGPLDSAGLGGAPEGQDDDPLSGELPDIEDALQQPLPGGLDDLVNEVTGGLVKGVLKP